MLRTEWSAGQVANENLHFKTLFKRILLMCDRKITLQILIGIYTTTTVKVWIMIMMIMYLLYFIIIPSHFTVFLLDENKSVCS